LEVGGRFEAAHLTLALARRLMRNLYAIVGIPGRAVNNGRHHGAVGRGVTPEFVGDQLPRHTALAF
jgi:hypothetical protein